MMLLPFLVSGMMSLGAPITTPSYSNPAAAVEVAPLNESVFLVLSLREVYARWPLECTREDVIQHREWVQRMSGHAQSYPAIAEAFGGLVELSTQYEQMVVAAGVLEPSEGDSAAVWLDAEQSRVDGSDLKKGISTGIEAWFKSKGVRSVQARRARAEFAQAMSLSLQKAKQVAFGIADQAGVSREATGFTGRSGDLIDQVASHRLDPFTIFAFGSRPILDDSPKYQVYGAALMSEAALLIPRTDAYDDWRQDMHQRAAQRAVFACGVEWEEGTEGYEAHSYPTPSTERALEICRAYINAYDKPLAHYYLSLMLNYAGDASAAVKHVDTAESAFGANSDIALELKSEVAYSAACIHSQVGNTEKAFELLVRSLRMERYRASWARLDPELVAVREAYPKEFDDETEVRWSWTAGTEERAGWIIVTNQSEFTLHDVSFVILMEGDEEVEFGPIAELETEFAWELPAGLDVAELSAYLAAREM